MNKNVITSEKIPIKLWLDDIEKGDTFRVVITYGPPDRSWEVTPVEPVIVDFNGEEQTTNEDGIVEFTFPDTRYDYEYDITAEGSDTHLASTETITDNDTSNQNDVEENKVIAAISYLGILCLVPLLLKKDSQYAQFHGKQGLVLLIAWVVFGAVMMIPILGWLVGLLGNIACLILMIVGLVNALQGVQYIFIFLLVILFTTTLPKLIKEKFTKELVIQKIIAILIIGIGLYLIAV